MLSKKQYIIYQCIVCTKTNGTSYPSKNDIFVNRKERENTPLRHVSNDMDMWVGIRRCKHCKSWLIVVFCGFYFEPMAFAYVPYMTEHSGTLCPDTAKFAIKYLLKAGAKVPRKLRYRLT